MQAIRARQNFCTKFQTVREIPREIETCRRQQPIGRYIVDFVCFENRLIIEVDGGQHAAEKEKDIERDNYFMRNGFKVLRFWNNEIFTNIEGVLEVIRTKCLNHPPLHPLPSREGNI